MPMPIHALRPESPMQNSAGEDEALFYDGASLDWQRSFDYLRNENAD
jgi:hypothetical protein